MYSFFARRSVRITALLSGQRASPLVSTFAGQRTGSFDRKCYLSTPNFNQTEPTTGAAVRHPYPVNDRSDRSRWGRVAAYRQSITLPARKWITALLGTREISLGSRRQSDSNALRKLRALLLAQVQQLMRLSRLFRADWQRYTQVRPRDLRRKPPLKHFDLAAIVSLCSDGRY